MSFEECGKIQAWGCSDDFNSLTLLYLCTIPADAEHQLIFATHTCKQIYWHSSFNRNRDANTLIQFSWNMILLQKWCYLLTNSFCLWCISARQPSLSQAMQECFRPQPEMLAVDILTVKHMHLSCHFKRHLSDWEAITKFPERPSQS